MTTPHGKTVARGEVKRVDTVLCVCGAEVQCSRALFKANNGRQFWLNIFAKHSRPSGGECTEPKEWTGGTA